MRVDWITDDNVQLDMDSSEYVAILSAINFIQNVTGDLLAVPFLQGMQRVMLNGMEDRDKLKMGVR